MSYDYSQIRSHLSPDLRQRLDTDARSQFMENSLKVRDKKSGAGEKFMALGNFKTEKKRHGTY